MSENSEPNTNSQSQPKWLVLPEQQSRTQRYSIHNDIHQRKAADPHTGEAGNRTTHLFLINDLSVESIIITINFLPLLFTQKLPPYTPQCQHPFTLMHHPSILPHHLPPPPPPLFCGFSPAPAINEPKKPPTGHNIRRLHLVLN